MQTLEHFFLCPYCNAEISMLLDTSVVRQEYVEDCEVCCRPIEVKYKVQGEEVKNFRAETLEGEE